MVLHFDVPWEQMSLSLPHDGFAFASPQCAHAGGDSPHSDRATPASLIRSRGRDMLKKVLFACRIVLGCVCGYVRSVDGDF
jgi:hypothetical protein